MKKRLRYALLVTVLILTVCFPATLSAQEQSLVQKIIGIVTDRSSGASLPFATVEITGLPQARTVSDEDGQFTLERIPLGRYDVHASLAGYEPARMREVQVTSGKETSLEIRLNEKVRELGEVTVTVSTNKDEPLNEMALSGARMFSVEEASRYAGGLDDPGRLASAFAGVSPSVGNNGISIHGNAPSLLQWRLEDVEIPNPNHFADISTLGGGILSSLSSHVLGNSDFFTGAFPAEYGNAVSGVFDMKLRNGNNRKYEHTFQAGILGLDFASEGPLSPTNKASYIVNYRYSTTTLLRKLGTDLVDGKMDYQDLNFKLNFPTRRTGIFSVWANGLIDNYESDFDNNTQEWESLEDRTLSGAKQTMLAGGVSHRYFCGNGGAWKTTLASSYHKQEAWIDRNDYDLLRTPYMELANRNTRVVLTSSYNRKINTRVTSKSGFTYTKLFYNADIRLASYEAQPLDLISKGDGSTDLVSAYTSSLIHLGNRFTISTGLHGQWMTLNDEWTVEPRVSARWQPTERSTISIAYGLHSRMEKMDVYFVKDKETGRSVNKDLGFTKSHHFNLTYAYKLSDNMHLRIEPFAQLLFDVPVMADSSYSVLNRNTFYVEDALVNKGKGRNIGVDVTLEKYLTKGVYYMVTASLFDSRYKGGDDKWHKTRYNRNYILNGLIGKEWYLGKHKQNILSVNLKLTLQGGERHAPVDEAATLADPDHVVQYNEQSAYSEQLSPMFIANYSVSYKINKKKASHEFAVKALNATGYEEFYGHVYNEKKEKIEPYRGATSLANVSYKIQF